MLLYTPIAFGILRDSCRQGQLRATMAASVSWLKMVEMGQDETELE